VKNHKFLYTYYYIMKKLKIKYINNSCEYSEFSNSLNPLEIIIVQG
jgi:hypothetical protein